MSSSKARLPRGKTRGGQQTMAGVGPRVKHQVFETCVEAQSRTVSTLKPAPRRAHSPHDGECAREGAGFVRQTAGA